MKISPVWRNLTTKLSSTPLECKKEAKYLGVIFDEKMQWSSQISNITKKVNFKLCKIKSVASFLTSHTKKLLVNNALVMPYFHYCSPAWSSAAPFRLRKVDKKVVDASNFLGRKDNYSIYNVINKDMSLLIFKALNNLAPNALKLIWLETVILITLEEQQKIISSFLQPIINLDWKRLPVKHQNSGMIYLCNYWK